MAPVIALARSEATKAAKFATSASVGRRFSNVPERRHALEEIAAKAGNGFQGQVTGQSRPPILHISTLRSTEAQSTVPRNPIVGPHPGVAGLPAGRGPS